MMSTDRERASEIYTAFYRMLRSGDRSSIESMPLNELKTTLILHHKDSRQPAYKAIETRIAELEKIKDRERDKRDKIKYLIMGAFLTLMVGIILYLIEKY